MKRERRTLNVNDKTVCRQHPVGQSVSLRIWNLVELAVCQAARPGCSEFSRSHGRGFRSAYKGIWFFKNKTC